MTENEIEELKNNKEPYLLMDERKQILFQKAINEIRLHHFEYFVYYHLGVSWIIAEISPWNAPPIPNAIRLNPNYKN